MILGMSTIPVIAEIASAHEGRAELACDLVSLAAHAQCDAVKLQLFKRELLVCPSHPNYASFGEIELSPDAWKRVFQTAVRVGMPVVVEPYDEPSFHFAQQMNIAIAYKIPSSDTGNVRLLQLCGSQNRSVMLSAGGSTEVEIRQAIAVLRDSGCKEITLMHGFQDRPTDIRETHLNRIESLRSSFGVNVGIADHIDAEDTELAFTVPLMAVACGVSVIEKHITIDRARKGRDHFSALNPDEMARFVALVKRAELAMGSNSITLSERERNYRNLMKRQAVFACDVKAGERIASNSVVYKRTGKPGLVQNDVSRLVGKRCRTDMTADEPLLEENLEP